MNTELGLANLSHECLEQLELRQNPFTEHAGDTYIFSDQQTEMTINIILENLEKSSSTIVICGDQGVGKTTYLRKLLRKGYQRYQFCTLRAKTNMSFQDICDKITQRWVVHNTQESQTVDSIDNIEEYVITYLGQRNYGIIIIDDADRLGIDVINEVLTLKHRVNLALPNHLGIVITGKNSISLSLSELEGVNPAATQIYQVNVRPFNKEQTVNYVRFRLNTAGTCDQPLLSDDEIEGIHDASRGVARDIHRLAISALRNKCLQEGANVFTEPTEVSERKPVPLGKLAAFIVLPILIGLIVYALQQRPQESVTELSLPASKVDSDDTYVEETPVPFEIPDSETIETLESSNTDTVPVPGRLEEQAMIKSTPHAHDDLDTDPTQEIVSDSTTTTDTRPIDAAKDATHSNADTVQPEPTTLAEEIADESTQAAVENNSVVPVPAAPTSGIAWLKQLPKNHYCLQLLASSEQKPLQDLVAKVGLKKDYAIYEKTVQGKKWHVLVSGNYPIKQDAIDALARLPDNLKRNKPWPVSVQSIHAQL